MADFRKFEGAWNREFRTPGGMVGQYLDNRGKALVRLAKGQVGVDTGALKRSIDHNVSVNRGGLIVKVTAHNKKALMHHQGTRPHVISARRAQALRFKWHGRIVYARSVNHPGTRPNRYLTDNLPKVI